MGLLVDGKWHDVWYDTASSGGRFIRSRSQFRNWITADGSPGPSGEGGFRAEPGRYHLYVSLACPWAHRVRIVRALKGLEDMIPESVVHWRMAENGWTFAAARPVGCFGYCPTHRQGIHTVHNLARNPISAGPAGHIGQLGGLGPRDRHGIQVVLADKHHRQVP